MVKPCIIRSLTVTQTEQRKGRPRRPRAGIRARQNRLHLVREKHADRDRAERQLARTSHAPATIVPEAERACPAGLCRTA